MRRAAFLVLAVLSVVTGCGDDPTPVAESKTCDAVRRHYDAMNVDDQDVQDRLEDRIVGTARSERPSTFVVTLANRFDKAIQEFREVGADLTDARRMYLIQEYQNVLNAMQASCEIPLGYPAEDTEAE